MLNSKHRPKLFLHVLIFSGLCLGQSNHAYNQPQRAPDLKVRSEDRAGQDAEQTVSLSYLAIRKILVREPGLLIEVRSSSCAKPTNRAACSEPIG
jgi:hypothetical protein